MTVPTQGWGVRFRPFTGNEFDVGELHTRKEVVNPISVAGSFVKGRGSLKLSYDGNPKRSIS